MRLAPKLPQNIQTIDIGQHDIEHHNVTILAQSESQSITTIGGLTHTEALAGKVTGQQLP